MKHIKTIIILFAVSLAVSCTVEDCAECRRIVVDENGKIIKDNDTPKKYCGDQLDAKENEEPVTWEGETSYYLCQ